MTWSETVEKIRIEFCEVVLYKYGNYDTLSTAWAAQQALFPVPPHTPGVYSDPRTELQSYMVRVIILCCIVSSIIMAVSWPTALFLTLISVQSFSCATKNT